MKFAAKIHHIDEEAFEAVNHENEKRLLVGRRIPLTQNLCLL